MLAFFIVMRAFYHDYDYQTFDKNAGITIYL